MSAKETEAMGIQNGHVQSDDDEETKEPNDDLENELDEYYKDMPLTDETTCGFWFIKGTVLQSMANKKILVLLFGLAGGFFSSTFSYFNGTITTIEKRFRIPSKVTGIISVGNDITVLLASVVLNYYASRGHRPRWIAFGLYCVAIFCFLNALPHLIYGAGEDALQLTFEYGEDYAQNSTKSLLPFHKTKHLCVPDENEGCNLEYGSIVPPVIWFVSQLISGIGGVLYFSLGYSYMDDNIKKSKSPVFISFSYFMRMLGPALGYGMVSVCLKLYIAPELTPTIDNLDPRWLGAWWLGWYINGIIIVILATLMALLPKTLPRAAARRELLKKKNRLTEAEIHGQLSIKDMMKTIERLIHNPVYVFNQIATIFYVFGYLPFWIFLPKYIETQYRKSASIASLVTGSVGLFFAAIGILLAGIIVQKFKPKARYMACWNMLIDLFSMFGILSYSLLGCSAIDEQIPVFSGAEYNTTMSCNIDCKCDYVKFSPICAMDKSYTYISACHAGCTNQKTFENGTIMYSNCSCIQPSLSFGTWENNTKFEQGGYAFSGACPVDCNDQFYAFVAIICVLKLIGSLSRVTNFLVSVRCVEERDKSVSLGISFGTLSLFALIPAPIFFGYVIDSTCLVWGKTCVGTGNCWFFNATLMRERLIYISSTFLFIGVLFDAVIWWKVNDLNMFDDGLKDNKKDKNKNDNVDVSEKNVDKRTDDEKMCQKS